MKEIPMDCLIHEQSEIILYKAKVDKKIIPLVRWLNSFKGVLTRWSCEGTNNRYNPYISVWVETRNESSPTIPDNDLNEWDIVCSYLKQYPTYIQKESIKGDIKVYIIKFLSTDSMLKIQRSLLKQYSKEKEIKNKEERDKK